MFIYKRCSRLTLIFIKNNKINYLNKYPQSYNNLLSNLPIYTNYLLVKSNLFIQYRHYYSHNQGSTLHFQNGDTEKLEILKFIKDKSGIYM